MISTVDETGVTETLAGLYKKEFANLVISGGMVAEKNKDCFFLGRMANNFLISLTKPISSIRSASSNTNIFTSANWINF